MTRIKGSPLSPAEREQRKSAAKLAGRPTKGARAQRPGRVYVTKGPGGRTIARKRRAVLEARKLYVAAQKEAARTIIDGMRGLLPGSTSADIIRCAEIVAAKGGNADAVITVAMTRAAMKQKGGFAVRIGTDEIERTEAEARAEEHAE